MSGGIGSEFVTIADLSARLDEPVDLSDSSEQARANSALRLAEALAARILGTSTLEQREITSKIRLPRYRRTVELEDGPVASIADVGTVLVAGTAVDASVLNLPHPWLLGRTDEDFPKGDLLTITYSPGFRVESSTTTMPQQIKEMILTLAADAWQNPDKRTIQERIGDYMRMTAGRTDEESASQAILQEAELLSQGWRRPMGV